MSIRTWLTLCATVLLIPTLAIGQGPGGGAPNGGFGGRGMGGRGGFGGMNFDPEQIFKMMSGGKDVIVRDQLDQRWQPMFDKIAQSMGITNGQMTIEQYREASAQFMAKFAGGGMGMGMGKGQDGGGAPGLGFGRGNAGGAPVTVGGLGGQGFGGFGRMNMSDPNGQPLSPEARMDARAENMFRRMNKKGDGLLSVEEMGEPLATERDKWDTNQDGFIDLNEFKAYYAARRKIIETEREANNPNPDSADEEDQPKKPVVYRSGNLPPDLMPWFAEIDTNHDAQISLAEWRASGNDLTLFHAMDHNGDNLITVEEAQLYMKLNKLTSATILASSRGSSADYDPETDTRRPLAGFTAPGEFIGSSSALASNDRRGSTQGADANATMPVSTPPSGFLGRGPNLSNGNGSQFIRSFDRGGPGGGNRGDRGPGGDQSGNPGRRGPGGRGPGRGFGGGPGGFGGSQAAPASGTGTGGDGSTDSTNPGRGRRGPRSSEN